jgi:ribose 5-phosphate isomerase RpiB
LCLSLRLTTEAVAAEILDAWFNTPLGTDPDDVAAVEYVKEIEGRAAEKGAGRE